MSQEKWAGFDRQRPLSLKGAGIQNSLRSMTPPKNEKESGCLSKQAHFSWFTLYLFKDAVASTKNSLERGNEKKNNDSQVLHSHFKVCHIETNFLL